MTDHDEHLPDGDTPGSPAPAYPQQPHEAERPVPLRRMPERTQDPSDWDVAGTESSTPRDVDDVVTHRRAQEEEAREGGDVQRGESFASVTEHESSYSTEIEQGAAAPRPARPEFQQDDDG